MIFEDDAMTRDLHNYHKGIILDKFPCLSSVSDAKYLSLKEYVTDAPQKFYDTGVFELYLNFLLKLKNDSPQTLVELFNDRKFSLDLGVKSLESINQLDIHDPALPKEYLDKIRYLQNTIHFNYLSLLESSFHAFIYLLAAHRRISRNKSLQGLDVYNCVEELKSSEFSMIVKSYNNIIRNGIAHGDIQYNDNDIIYKARGEQKEATVQEMVTLFDDTVDVCNALCLALKMFVIMNHDFLIENEVHIPRTLLLQELKSQANTPYWVIEDCLEMNFNIMERKQLNIYCYNSLQYYSEVNLQAFRTAVMTEYFSPGYDRYFIYLKSKYSKCAGWAAYDGNILKSGRLKGNDAPLDYVGVLEDDLLYFIPKINMPKWTHKFSYMARWVKITFPLHFHSINKRQYIIRNSNSHRRGARIVINDPRVYVSIQDAKELVSFIRQNHRHIIKSCIRNAKKQSKFLFARFLKTEYIRVSLYDKDFRKRTFDGLGLSENLIGTIEFNASKKIKTIDILGGIPEQHGQYRIVWNSKWRALS